MSSAWHVQSHPGDKVGKKVHAKLVDSRSHSYQLPSVKPVSTRPQLTQSRQPSFSRIIHLANNNFGEKCTAVHVNQVQHGKFSERNDGEDRNFNSMRTRKQNDPVEDLQGKVESLEKALDHVYFAMKTKFHDVRDSLKLSTRPPQPPAGSSPFGSFQASKKTAVDFYRHPSTRTNNQIDL